MKLLSPIKLYKNVVKTIFILDKSLKQEISIKSNHAAIISNYVHLNQKAGKGQVKYWHLIVVIFFFF